MQTVQKPSAQPLSTDSEQQSSENSLEAQITDLAAADFSALQQINTLSVTQTIGPLRLELSNQNVIQLIGLDIPDLTPYEAGPIAGAAQDFLEMATLNSKVRLYQTKNKDKGRQSRLGHQLGHLELVKSSSSHMAGGQNDVLWLQGALLANGLARVRPSSIHTEMAAQMLEIEKTAREQKAGLWADPAYQVMTPEQSENAMNQWGIVEGVIKGAAIVRNTVYLNFGANWREDFTIAIPASVRKDMAQHGVNPLDLSHKAVRVRGWIRKYNGPYIELQDKVWLEILPEQSATPEMDVKDHSSHETKRSLRHAE